MPASHVAASEPGEKASRFPADAASEPRLEWVQNITEDNADGEYFTKKLGMDRVTRQSVLRTIEESWTEGLMYNLSAYTIDHTNAAECTNNGSEQYAGRVRKNYGYNCTGFVASVLYYANGGSRENALENMNELYMPLKKAGGRGSMRSFTDGTGWYYFAAGRGEEALDGSPEKKTKIYSLGETRGPEDLQAIPTVIAMAEDHPVYSSDHETLIVVRRSLEPIINEMQEAIEIMDGELKCVQQD